MATVIAGECSLLHLQLVIVEELLEKTRFRVLIELRTDQISTAVPGTSLAEGVNLNLLSRRALPVVLSLGLLSVASLRAFIESQVV